MAKVGTSRRAAFDHDPFAGDDELWLEEDFWVATPRGRPLPADRSAGALRFFRGLLVALALAALVWSTFAAVALIVHRLWS
jgi:hypothetical protein